MSPDSRTQKIANENKAKQIYSPNLAGNLVHNKNYHFLLSESRKKRNKDYSKRLPNVCMFQSKYILCFIPFLLEKWHVYIYITVNNI